MKFLTTAAVLASVASAASIGKRATDSPLDVQLEQIGNSAVKVKVTNTGAEELRILRSGTILDGAPVEKVKVFQGENKVAFEGVRLRLATTDLADDAFQSIAAGESVEVLFDAAELHDLTAGGDFAFVADGVLSYAAAGSNELSGAAPYASNTITVKVDGAQAEQARAAFIEKRTAVQSDCTSTRSTATRNAITNCRSLASAASSAARSNTAKLQEYFKSTSSSVATQVATVFGRVVSECGSATGGVSRTYCTDVYGACSSNVLAYTLPSGSYIVNCPLYFSALPALTRSCHAQDQATTTLHEVTHLSQIAGTDDLGYGYSAATRLSSSQALNNADSYALFANAIYAGC